MVKETLTIATRTGGIAPRHAVVVKDTPAVANISVDKPRIFTERRRVQASEIDELGHVSNVDYVRWIQDVAKAHSANLGWDYAKYLEIGAVFVVRRHEVDYLQSAHEGDEVVLTTWVESWSAATSIRRTNILRLKDDTALIRAETTWALITLETARPTRIPKHLREAFSESPP